MAAGRADGRARRLGLPSGRFALGFRGFSRRCVCRSPSPEPIYSTDGKRLNTREYRTRRKLEEERHRLVQRMQQINPDFKPPPDYKCVSARRPPAPRRPL